jgi:hypothetical protein
MGRENGSADWENVDGSCPWPQAKPIPDRRFGRRNSSMTDLQPDHFSQFIASIFAKAGVFEPWAETILLVDRRYVGRKFRAGGYQVVWWIEKNVIEVFNQDGQSLENLDLGQKVGMTA